METKDTLFHINWGDEDNFYVVAPDEKTAIERMPDGKDMVNYIVRLDLLYQMILQEGIKEVVEFIQEEGYLMGNRWQAKLKEWLGSKEDKKE